MNYDKESFIAGLQFGRRMKAMEIHRHIFPPERSVLVTEKKDPLLTEDGKEFIPEGGAA